MKDMVETLERLIKENLKPDSSVTTLIGDLNEAFRRHRFGPHWSFVEAGRSVDDSTMLIIQTTVGAEARTFNIKIRDILAILNG